MASQAYVLGDSLTEGMGNGGLARGLEEQGISAELNGSVGRTLEEGLAEVQRNSSAIKDSDQVVIGLGTNDFSADKDTLVGKMTAIVEEVRRVNPDAEISWVDFALGGDKQDEARVLNASLDQVAKEHDVNVIGWGSSGKAKENLTGDGIHQSDYGPMADFVAGAIGKNRKSSDSGAGKDEKPASGEDKSDSGARADSTTKSESGNSGGDGLQVDVDSLDNYVKEANALGEDLGELAKQRLPKVGDVSDDGFGALAEETGFTEALQHFGGALRKQVKTIGENATLLADNVAETAKRYRDSEDERAADAKNLEKA